MKRREGLQLVVVVDRLPRSQICHLSHGVRVSERPCTCSAAAPFPQHPTTRETTPLIPHLPTPVQS